MWWIILTVNSRCRKTRQSVDGVTLCSPPQESFSLFSSFCLFFISDTCSTPSDIFHLFGFRLRSTEGHIKQQLQNSSFFDVQKAHSAFVLWGGGRVESGSDQLSVFFFLPYCLHLLVFQGLSAKYRKRMCWVCMLLKQGQAWFKCKAM